MRKLLLVPIAALIFVVGAVAPAGAGKLPVPLPGVEDVCACGGYITYTFYRRYEKGAFDECYYEGRAPNGTVVNYLVLVVPSSQSC